MTCVGKCGLLLRDPVSVYATAPADWARNKKNTMEGYWNVEKTCYHLIFTIQKKKGKKKKKRQHQIHLVRKFNDNNRKLIFKNLLIMGMLCSSDRNMNAEIVKTKYMLGGGGKIQDVEEEDGDREWKNVKLNI